MRSNPSKQEAVKKSKSHELRLMREKILAYLGDAEKPLTTGDIAKAVNADFPEVRKTLRGLYHHKHIEQVMSDGQPFKSRSMTHLVRYTKPKGLTLEIHWQLPGGF